MAKSTRVKVQAERTENPTWIRQPATGGLGRPPTVTQLQSLPLKDLAWENFERLCYRLASAGGDVELAVLFGKRGQKQDGIDIYVRLPGKQRYSCWQSKKYDRLSASVLKKAVAEFEKGDWAPKTDEFVICTSASIQDTSLQSEIETQTAKLKAKNILLRVVGETELSAELKDKPKLVRDFFGNDWVKAFIAADDVPSPPLDVDDIALLRRELRALYESSFGSLDPGIVVNDPANADRGRSLAVLDRFIEPDIEITGPAAGMAAERTLATAQEPSTSDFAAPSAGPSTAASGRETLRRQVSRWIAEGDHTVIVADAGLGKTTTLRVFALDMLGDGERFPSVSQRWAYHLPIVLPFAFWSRQVSKDEQDVSLADAIRTWFKKYGVSDQLLKLMTRSLEEQRALLLLDGLDEWSDEAAARSTLALLTTVVKTKAIPAILTGRPGGLTRLGALDPIWRQGRLGALSERQQRTLTTTWFRHIYPRSKGQSDADRTNWIGGRVAAFFADLAQAGTLLTLSGVPLLLAGLISLYVRHVSLPRSRFQAYATLIDLLLEEHPGRRAQAALDRGTRFRVVVDRDLRRRALAEFAFEKRLRGLDAGCSISEARTIILDYLKSQDGAGFSSADAIAGAEELLRVDAETAGLLVEKAPKEIAFVHAVFEEALVGEHLSGWRLTEQEEFVRLHGGDARWSTSILAMMHNLTRPSDVDALVSALRGEKGPPGISDFVREALVAEIVFGDFRCSPRLAAELTPALIDAITREGWLPHREAITRHVLEAAASPGARQGTRDYLLKWFPDPMTYRERIYGAMTNWPKDEVLGLLWLGLYSDRPENKHAAGMTIATLFAEDPVIETRLRQAAISVADGETVAAALEALMQGWWNSTSLDPLIKTARASDHSHLRLLGIRGRIKQSKHDDDDLQEVLALADDDRSFVQPYQAWIYQTLAAGWPSNPKVVAAALASVRRGFRPRGQISTDVAKQYLLRFCHSDPKLDREVAELIRQDEHFFSTLGRDLYLRGDYGPEVRSALDFRLDQMDAVLTNYYVHLALMSNSDHAKHALIRLLDDDRWIFWPVYGLLEGWGMDDPEVSATLSSVAGRPPERLQFLAHHLPEIVSDKQSCRRKLLAIASIDKLDRPDFLLRGFTRLGVSSDDDEVMDAILSIDFSRRGIFDATSELIAGFASHPAVRKITLARMQEIDAPWEAIAQAYAGDEEIRGVLARYLSALPVELRGLVVSVLGKRAADDPYLLRLLSAYKVEANHAIRTAAAIALYEAAGDEMIGREVYLARLRDEAVMIGPYMDLIRQSSLAGFIALGQVEEYRDLPEHSGQLELFALENRVALAYIARQWQRLKDAFGTDVLSHLTRSDNEWYSWDHLAPYTSESDAICADFIEYCTRETKILAANCIEALAREVPGSHLLRDHCLRALGGASSDVNSSGYDSRRRDVVAGVILGQRFATDDSVRNALEAASVSHSSAAIAGLCEGWPTSKVLEDLFISLEESGQAGRLIWPDAIRLIAARGTTEAFCRIVLSYISQAQLNIWDFSAICVELIVARLTDEDECGTQLLAKLGTSPTPSEKASLPKLLALAGRMSEELRRWCESELAAQYSSDTLVDFGADIIVGTVRPICYALLDALSPNQA